MDYGLIAIVSALVAWVLVRLVLWLFPRVGLMDRPHKYGLKRKPIPYYAGLVILVSLVFGILCWLKLDTRLLFLLGGALVVVAVSFLDDFRGISPYLRLLVQVGVSAGMFFGGISVFALPNPFGPEIGLMTVTVGGVAVLSLVATVLWYVLIMNTMNWIDGLNGLPSGVSAIAFATIFFLSIKPGFHAIDQTVVAVIGLVMAVTMLIFWFYDFYPAKILMGDTGSMLLGFLLASMAIYSGGKLATASLALGFPILDAIWVIGRRLMSGKSPFRGDLMHFHHRLIHAGLTVRQALWVIYGLCAVFGAMALVLDHGQKVWALIGLLTVMAVVGFGVVLMEESKES